MLDDFNLSLNEGENLVIMGKSGSGKSVMIKCLIGLEIPDSGTIEIMGKKLLRIIIPLVVALLPLRKKIPMKHIV